MSSISDKRGESKVLKSSNNNESFTISLEPITPLVAEIEALIADSYKAKAVVNKAKANAVVNTDVEFLSTTCSYTKSIPYTFPENILLFILKSTFVSAQLGISRRFWCSVEFTEAAI